MTKNVVHCVTCGSYYRQEEVHECSRFDIAEKLATANARIAELERESKELNFTFDLRHKADMRAIKRWREATGQELVQPDHADLCVWLLEREKALRTAIEAKVRGHEAIADDAAEVIKGVEQLMEGSSEQELTEATHSWRREEKIYRSFAAELRALGEAK